MIQSFLCIPHIPVGYAGGTTPRMGEVELRREQQSRAPTVGALGAASAPRQLFLRCSTSCILAVVLTLSTYIHVGNAGSSYRGTEAFPADYLYPMGIPACDSPLQGNRLSLNQHYRKQSWQPSHSKANL
jgi:hypothetical protein